MRYFVFFFFQAEDGIRDGHVTGVQTCALPIYVPKGSDLWCRRQLRGKAASLILCLSVLDGGSPKDPRSAPLVARLQIGSRSEERRVGKECRSRRAPEA